MAAFRPSRALLHEVVTTAAGPDGTSYSVAYVLDPDGGRHLVFASTAHFGDLALLPLMQHCEINLSDGSRCLEVLPLHLQSEDLQLQVAEQIRLLSMPGHPVCTERSTSQC
jgi:hypothetical protein